MKRRAIGGLVVSTILGGCTGTGSESTRRLDEDDTKFERFVIENRSNSRSVVQIEVSQNGETMLAGCYDCPPDTGLQFDEKFPWGEYTIRGRIQGHDWNKAEWEARTCAGTPRSDGNRNAGFVVTAESSGEIMRNVCDYIKLGSTYVAVYEQANDYEAPCDSA